MCTVSWQAKAADETAVEKWRVSEIELKRHLRQKVVSIPAGYKPKICDSLVSKLGPYQ